jgi:hypothetical protein
MRSLLVVNYPNISADNFAWIQKIRQQEDELNFSMIDRATLVNHVKQSIKDIKPFEFTLRCGVLCNDAFSKYTHVFLVPDEEYSNIVKLHDRLYKGIIAD